MRKSIRIQSRILLIDCTDDDRCVAREIELIYNKKEENK